MNESQEPETTVYAATCLAVFLLAFVIAIKLLEALSPFMRF
jgi:hypothetical protein